MFQKVIIEMLLHLMKFYEMLEYYAIYCWLTLPAYMFGFLGPIKVITYDDDDNQITTYTLINGVHVILKPEHNKLAKHITLSQGHILPILNDGRILISDLKKYYPTIDTFVISYTKNYDNIPMHIHRVVDIQKKYDVRNTESCSTGIKIY